MAATSPLQSIKNNPVEKEFRNKNLWHSFMQAAYGALGGASFFGALMVIAQGVMGLAATAGGIATLGANAAAAQTASAFLVTNPITLAAIGGLIAAGLAFTYMSQREGTELKVLQDEHLAQQTAIQHSMGRAPSLNIEHEQNQRADGKQWQEVVHGAPSQNLTRH